MKFLKTRALLACLLLLTSYCLANRVDATFGAEPRQIGLLLDEQPIVPMRVEADIIAQIVDEIASNEKEAFGALDALVPTTSGVTTRSGNACDLNKYDVVLVYQGDEITNATALFSESVVAQLKGYLANRPRASLVLLGGSCALAQPLGLSACKTSPLTFGEDRAQTGITPINPQASVYSGVEYDRGIVWTTNASFPAFAEFSAQGDDVRLLGNSQAEGKPNPFYAVTTGTGAETRVRAYLLAQRVSPLFDSAPETYRNNFKRLIRNALLSAGSVVSENDFVAPLFASPDFDALQRALDYYEENYDENEYPNGANYAERLERLRTLATELQEEIDARGTEVVDLAERAQKIRDDFSALQKEALLDSPELDFESFLFIRRDPKQMGLPENYNSNSSIPRVGYNDELCRFRLRDGAVSVVYKPEQGEFIGDLELYYDASKIMFSSPDVATNERWRVWELPLDENGDAAGRPSALKLVDDPDVDNYDACYLPDDRVIFCSTAPMTGVPCINGSGHVCNLYLLEKDVSIRQLTLEQDHDWNPVVMNNGRVMYLRWEYVDLPHCFSRIVFHMNPDGTNQSELYGSGSYWPNSVFYARPLPGDSGKFSGIVTGHHELNRMGDLVIFDPAKGRKEATGAVQRVPGYGKKVEPIACDLPIAQNWPKFINAFPISETLFLTSCKRASDAPWEICLADVFDNIVPIASFPEFASLEPIPLRATERQPILPDRVQLDSPTADVFIADIYEGEGLRGVPRGEVKSIRVFSYQFAYQGMGAEPYSVGLDGPWDPRTIIGEVPVLEDGSASFKIPAYVPVALQPLDKDGKAIQIMRSWITALPGESVSCVGCHEPQNSTAATNPRAMAAQIAPMEIKPFYGPARGFSFEKEIQPILDRYCVECHQPDSPKIAELIEQGKIPKELTASEKRPNETFEISRIPDFRRSEPKNVLDVGNYIAVKSPLSNGYYQLRRYVNTVTKESQAPTHRPYEFHADVSPLVQILTSGRHYVELDPESWAKLITWIDLNCPYNGSWGETVRDNPNLVKSQFKRREELRALYAPSSERIDDDPNAEPQTDAEPTSTLRLRFESTPALDTLGAPISVSANELGQTTRVSLDDGVDLELVSLPGAGISVGRFEITNEQYRLYDPEFDAGIEYGDFIQFSPGERGWLLSRKRQPVARVTQEDAEKFCAWLSEKTGDKYRLPTLTEWLAFSDATSDGFWFGGFDSDYGAFENLGDSSRAIISGFGWRGRVETLPNWRPVDWNVNDASRTSAPVGSYQPNRFGLYDVVGNVSEWTSSELVFTTKIVDSATDEVKSENRTRKKIAAGGSWITPARYAKPDTIRAYPAHYNLRDVGFRVLREDK